MGLSTFEEEICVIACAAHMANRAYCLALGDTSQPTWEDAPDWQKTSARAGVRAALDSAQTPEKSHESWIAQKAAEGWTYGSVKDLEKKQHPCFVPYDQLPAEQRLKDEIFLTTVRTLAKTIGVLWMEKFKPWRGGAMPLSDAEVWVRAVVAALTSDNTRTAERAGDIADAIVVEYLKRVDATITANRRGAEARACE